MNRHYAIVKKGAKKYYFTGSSFDSVPFSMKKYPTLSALKKAVTPYARQLPKNAKLYSEIVAKPIKKSKKKTAKKSKKKR